MLLHFNKKKTKEYNKSYEYSSGDSRFGQHIVSTVSYSWKNEMSKIADFVITDGHNDRYTHWPIRNMQF